MAILKTGLPVVSGIAADESVENIEVFSTSVYV